MTLALQLLNLMFFGFICMTTLVGQQDSADKKAHVVYVLKDDSVGKWCAYSDKERFERAIADLPSFIAASGLYRMGALESMYVKHSDQTGDWEVIDRYELDHKGRIIRIARRVNIIPDNTSEEQIIIVRNGSVTSKRIAYHDLKTDRSVGRFYSWLTPPPVVTRIENFPFARLLPWRKPTSIVAARTCVALEPT
jgi:hypothetical protein